MALIISCILLAYQSSKAGWHPKEIAYPDGMARVAFQVYVPPSATGFVVRRVLLVWVPKLGDFPGRPGRQAVRITVADKDGRTVELFETSSIALPYKTNLGQIIGQGYLDFPLAIGTTIVELNMGRVCLGLISKDLGSNRLHELAERLKPSGRRASHRSIHALP